MAQDTFNVSVEVSVISEIKGKILASVSNDATNFPAANFVTSTTAEEVKSNNVTLTFKDIPADADYVVILFQDLNDNGILDMNGSVPAEPFGFSNYVMMGPPTWEGCSFTLDEDQKLDINLYSF